MVKKQTVKSDGICCLQWKRTIDRLEVRPRLYEDPKEKMMAEAVEKLMKWAMGNYCPCCGTKIKE